MSLMVNMGKAPVGELYFQPPDLSGEAWLMGHYYNGSSVKLIRFKKPLSAPEEGSPMHRIYTLEDDHLFHSQVLLRILNLIDGAHDSDLGIAEMEAHIAEKRAFISQRDKLNQTNSPYMITNFELLQKTRGWTGG